MEYIFEQPVVDLVILLVSLPEDHDFYKPRTDISQAVVSLAAEGSSSAACTRFCVACLVVLWGVCR